MLLLFITCMVLMIVLCTYIVTALAFSRTAVLGGKTPWQLTNVICLVGLVLSGVLGITAHVATADDPSVFVMALMGVSVVLSVLCAFTDRARQKQTRLGVCMRGRLSWLQSG